jgi:hypothetical protein
MIRLSFGENFNYLIALLLYFSSEKETLFLLADDHTETSPCTHTFRTPYEER